MKKLFLKLIKPFQKNKEEVVADSKVKRIYFFKFKVSYPVENKGYAETSEIHCKVHAYTESGAKTKLKNHVKNKIKLTVIDCSTNKNDIYVSENV